MSPAAFDYYAVLEIDASATKQQITSAFRRLALIHHPDKNPDVPGATARFQQVKSIERSQVRCGADFFSQINTAYEILKDDAKRAAYDHQNRPASSNTVNLGRCNHPPCSNFYCDHPRRQEPSGGPSNVRSDWARRGFHGYGHSSPSNEDSTWRQTYEARKAEAELRQRQQTYAREAEEERQQERAEQEARDVALRQAQEKLQRAQEAKQVKQRARKEQQTRKRQEKFWADQDITTAAAKKETCEHVEFWPAETLRKKFKCEQCGVKRGMKAFVCPLCHFHACQICRPKLATKSGSFGGPEADPVFPFSPDGSPRKHR